MSLQPGTAGAGVTDPQARFGSSFLVLDGDLVLSGADLVLVHGVANLKQALSLRLLTPYGTDQVNTSYGLDAAAAFTGSHGRRMAQELIRLGVVRTLATDPRVREVTSVLFDDDPGFVAQVLAAGGQPAGHRDRLWQLVVTVETVQDSTALVLVDVEL